jgi:hypothetical protein
MAETQNYKNHVRQLPAYVIAVFVVLLANIVRSGYLIYERPSFDSVLAFLIALSLVVIAFVARTQSLTVQNRVIRLEQRLRYRELLPADVAARAMTLPIDKIVALRFASDAELPALVNDALGGTLATAKDIKLKVQDWQADFLRA